MNLSVFFGVQLWVYLAVAVVIGPVMCFNGGGDDSDGLVKSNVEKVQQQLNKRWKMILSSSWWKKNNNTASTVVIPSTKPMQRAVQIADGIFVKKDRCRSKDKRTSTIERRNVVNRANEADDGVNNATVSDGVLTATTGVGFAVFGTEDECVLANKGRPCVCYMTEFLNSIGERLNETATDNQTSVATAFRCPSYKQVPASFVIFPTVNTTATSINNTTTDVNTLEQRNLTNDGDNRTADVPVRKEVDFDYVVNYQLETSKDNHYTVHYSLVGSDVRVRCLINSDDNNTGIKAFKWKYTMSKNKTNSTITSTDMNNLLILGLDPKDSKNYTCLPDTSTFKNSKSDRPYTHYVIAVKKPIYEIHGTAFYKTINSGGCTSEIISYVRKELPNFIRSEICPERSSRYACNVNVETAKCLKEEGGTLEINYLVMLNENTSYLTRIRTSKKGQDALYQQKLLARISNVLVENFRKSLTVQITSQMSPVSTHFELDYGRTKINKYVSCSPGFGIREVFCAACPSHHYSPDKTADCLKCLKGFHQPNAGSKKCVKCPSIFSSGCYMSEVPYIFYYVAGFICLYMLLVMVMFCRKENETSIVALFFILIIVIVISYLEARASYLTHYKYHSTSPTNGK